MRESYNNNKRLFDSKTCYDLYSPELDTKLTFDFSKQHTLPSSIIKSEPSFVCCSTYYNIAHELYNIHDS